MTPKEMFIFAPIRTTIMVLCFTVAAILFVALTTMLIMMNFGT